MAQNRNCRYKVTKKTKRIPGKAGLRYYKNVGLGFKTPKEAIEGIFQPPVLPKGTMEPMQPSDALNGAMSLVQRHCTCRCDQMFSQE